MHEDLFKVSLLFHREKAGERFAKDKSLKSLWYFPTVSKPLPAHAIENNPFLLPGTPFYIIDFFGNRMPIAFDRKSVESSTTTLSFCRTVLLDSNLFNYIHWFVCRDAEKQCERDQFARLLEMLNSWRCDYNSLPYIFEQAAKNSATQADGYSQHIMRDTFLLHNMNEGLFSSSGAFELDEEKLVSQFGSTDVDFDRHAKTVLNGLTPPRSQHAW